MKRYLSFNTVLCLLVIGVTLYTINFSRKLHNRQPISEKPHAGEMAFIRAYPYNNVPDDGFYKGFDDAQKSLVKFNRISAPDIWKSIGPNNFSGRIVSLTVDPGNSNIVFAGSASGGLWKLTITGSGWNDYFWERINTGHPVLGVGAIAIHPENSNIIYIGTGEAYFHKQYTIGLNRMIYTYGIGLLRSTDGGNTWAKSIDWSYNQNRGIHSVKFNPLNPNIIFAATTEGTYRSSDAGGSWKLVHETLMAMDLEIDPGNPDKIYVSCGNAGSPGTGIYRSEDGGDSWEQIGNGLPDTWTGKTLLDMSTADPSIIFADVANVIPYVGLFKTINGGDSWEFVTDKNLGNMGSYAHYVRVNPEDDQKIFKASTHYAYSEDGGRNWNITDEPSIWKTDSSKLHVDHHTFANDPSDPDVFFVGNDGGVWRTLDGGKTFQDLNKGLVTAQFYPGFASSKNDPDLAIGGLQDNNSAIYRGNGNWDKYVLYGDGGAGAVDEFDDNIIYGSLYWLGLFKSMDRGETFKFISPVNLFGTDDPEVYNPRGYDPHEDEWSKFPCPVHLVSPRIMYAATNYVYRSDDGGETWKSTNYDLKVHNQAIISMAVSKTNPDYVYVATYPNVYQGIRPEILVTKDGGKNWKNITSYLPDRYTTVYPSPHNENVVYAALSGFDTPHLYRSLNAGETWDNISDGLPDVPTNSVEVDPLDHRIIYVGNDLGMWVSVDDGNSWMQFKDGMPLASIVSDISISESNRKIRAVTHGSGVYERSMIELVAENVNTTPEKFELLQNYPNPFNPQTNITFEVDKTTQVSIRIYNIMGQLIKAVGNRQYHRGLNSFVWDGKNDNGQDAASGTYFYSVKVGNKVKTKKMLLLR